MLVAASVLLGAQGGAHGSGWLILQVLLWMGVLSSAWVLWRQRRSLSLSEEGLLEKTATAERRFAWAELRSVDLEVGLGQRPLHTYLVRCAGGRRLVFTNRSLEDADRLCEVLRTRIRWERARERPPSASGGAPPALRGPSLWARLAPLLIAGLALLLALAS